MIARRINDRRVYVNTLFPMRLRGMVQVCARRVVGHALAILAHDCGRRARRGAVGQPQVLGSDDDASSPSLSRSFEITDLSF